MAKEIYCVAKNLKVPILICIALFNVKLTKQKLYFQNYCGKKTEMGKLIQQVRNTYLIAKGDALPLIEEIMGEGALASTPSESDVSEAAESETTRKEDEEEEEEEVIRCICNIFKDEGLMIQCEKCHVRN